MTGAGLRPYARTTGERRTMYESHFGLRRRPFAASPDTDSYYPASSHEQALAQLALAVQDGEALALLTGTPGTGKTLLGQRLLEQVCPDGPCAFLTQGFFKGPVGLLQAIHHDLGLPYEGRAEQELRLTLTDHLLKTYADGQRVLLVLDEGQHLTPEQLEEVRLLGNLEGRQGKALQTVLLGQESLTSTLDRPELAALCQRIGAHARLTPMDLHESVDYLAHQLRQAGGRPEQILSDEALEILARASGGVPRLLNRAAHAALRLACQAGAVMVDAEVALESASTLGLAEGTAAADGEAEQPPFVNSDDLTTGDSAVLALGSVPPAEDHGPAGSRRLFAAPKRTA